jgi:hypothetical protein
MDSRRWEKKYAGKISNRSGERRKQQEMNNVNDITRHRQAMSLNAISRYSNEENVDHKQEVLHSKDAGSHKQGKTEARGVVLESTAEGQGITPCGQQRAAVRPSRRGDLPVDCAETRLYAVPASSSDQGLDVVMLLLCSCPLI